MFSRKTFHDFIDQIVTQINAEFVCLLPGQYMSLATVLYYLWYILRMK